MNQFKQILKLYLAISDKSNVKRYSVLLMSIFLAGVLSACKLTSVSSQSTNTGVAITTSSSAFLGGQKSVKILTNNSVSGSFSAFTSGSTILPTPTVIPPGWPGADGASEYNPGVSANQFFDMDGISVLTKPAWLNDVQLGLTSNTTGTANSCATFGASGNYDSVNDYRVSEANCINYHGTGSNGTLGDTFNNSVFIRIILNRAATTIGTSENLLIQVEYQASGIHLNSDGNGAGPEQNIDQLWKVFWNPSLSYLSTQKTFSVFVPPNYAGCIPSGTGYPGNAGNCAPTSYKGAPITVKQIMVPLSAYPSLSVIQLSRLDGRINVYGVGTQYGSIGNFCGIDSPLCAGLVIKSITLTRI